MTPTPATLPRDLEGSYALIRELLEQIQKRDREIEQLRHKVDQLARKLFRPKAETIDPNQLELIDLEALGVEKPEPDELEPATSEAPPRRRPRRKKAPKDLERRRVEHELPEAERRCGCGRIKQPISERISEQLDYQPAKVYVVQNVQRVYACGRCDDEGPVIAPKPAQIIEKGKAGAGLLAQIAVSKYAEHQPLYRQQEIFFRHGLEIARSTLSGWLSQLSDALEPVIASMRDDVLRSKILHTDDTSVPVLDPGTGATRKGRLWVYIGDLDHRSVVFDYTPTRERDGPADWLSEFEGYLQADAYPGYDGLFQSGKVLEVGCWAHARRYFYDASQVDPSVACQALAMIRRLFLVERKAKDRKLDAEGRKALRQEEALPILDAIKTWLDERPVDTLPKSPLATAVGYARNQWQALCRYTEDGDLSIDNNLSERQLRPVALGRKNWLFAGSDAAGVRAARFYTLVGTCKLHHIEPFAYLRSLFEQLPRTSLDQVRDLTPTRWAERQG